MDPMKIKDHLKQDVADQEAGIEDDKDLLDEAKEEAGEDPAEEKTESPEEESAEEDSEEEDDSEQEAKVIINVNFVRTSDGCMLKPKA